MTCVVGLAENGHVYIGADSAGIAGWDLTIRNDPKVFIRDPFIFGFTSSFRMGQLLRYSLKVPRQPDQMEDHEYMVTSFVNAVRECLRSGGYAKKDKEQEEGGVFLVGYRGGLYMVESDYQVGINADGFASVGCGAQAANGALYASASLPPSERVTMALHAAERLNAGVRGPFVVRAIGTST